ncbi:hypothetical protein MPTK1_1g06800 [Marchantia polymorpha subsp. ruderalis]|uniref:Uncharacterized protein n=2 Tax=Marchantia polymorpha TaxID=3197 RepID=A0AAF6AMB7_MARPO|nr:hypothetical protein MARPO_0043s0072 [Marchantia polymorpha]BBM97587.1 hypothetical protein Mp_1g06800 [Marchantia polymorpha subsp. ruderalis]|eukprot:PTQ39828.1 hypothetical protein MARPO_0043s0072 [Marchantia polymorpha]
MATIQRSFQRTCQLWRRVSQQSPALSTGLRHMSSTPEPITNKRLEGKVAIITGGAGAIGTATSKLFAAHGAQVVIADVSDERGEKLAQEIGHGAVYRRTDVTSEENVAATVAFAVEQFGQLDIMFNNAGVITPLDTFENLDMELYDRHTAVLVRGVVCGIKHAARAMIPRKRGVILNTASTASVRSGATMPLIYNINKFNIPGLTSVASFHLAKHGIRVNAVSPHGIPSGVVVDWLRLLGCDSTWEKVVAAFKAASPLPDRHTTNEDIANAALFLCSDESGYISGQNLVVDAGFCQSVVYDPLQLGDPFKSSP